MKSYHVSEDGKPRVCKTTPENCPLNIIFNDDNAGHAAHGQFSSARAAAAWAEDVNHERHQRDIKNRTDHVKQMLEQLRTYEILEDLLNTLHRNLAPEEQSSLGYLARLVGAYPKDPSLIAGYTRDGIKMFTIESPEFASEWCPEELLMLPVPEFTDDYFIDPSVVDFSRLEQFDFNQHRSDVLKEISRVSSVEAETS